MSDASLSSAVKNSLSLDERVVGREREHHQHQQLQRINNTDDTSSSSPHVELISPSTMLQSRVRSRRSIPVLDESGRASPSDKKESYSTYSTLGGLEALSTAAMRLSN